MSESWVMTLMTLKTDSDDSDESDESDDSDDSDDWWLWWRKHYMYCLKFAFCKNLNNSLEWPIVCGEYCVEKENFSMKCRSSWQNSIHLLWTHVNNKIDFFNVLISSVETNTCFLFNLDNKRNKDQVNFYTPYD